jgi:hypothetical protein
VAIRSGCIRETLICVAAALAVLPACAANRGGAEQRAAPLRSACAAALEELDIDSLPPADRLRASYDTARHKTIVVLPPEPGVVPASYGMKGITAIMQPASQPPAALPDLQLDFLVFSPEPRPPEERIVRFRLDNADSITAGPGVAVSAPTGSPGALEHVSVLITPNDLIQLLRAKTVRATLGATEFPVTERLRDGLRAMVLYVECGAA